MPYVILKPDGHIKEVMLKPSPRDVIGPGERLVRYDPPKVDEDMAAATPVLPVPPGQAAVEFTVTNKPDELAWMAVRRKRTKLLAESDWTQIADSPVDNSKRQQWATYRQALRDITKQPDPHNLTWPPIPG